MCVCVCLKAKERRIHRETQCVHEWVRPLFQKIWPEPRTSCKHLCNSALTNSMLSWESVGLHVCINKIHVIFKLYRSVLFIPCPVYFTWFTFHYSSTSWSCVYSVGAFHCNPSWLLQCYCHCKDNVTWFHKAEQNMLYHGLPVLDWQVDMRSWAGAIKVNYNC